MTTETTESVRARRVVRTSVDAPLQVDWVELGPELKGALGLTVCPGMHGVGVDGGWRRDLTLDLQALVAERVSLLVSMVPDDELVALGVGELPVQASRLKLRVVRLPVREGHAPDENAWLAWMLERFMRELTAGGRLVLHCRGFDRAGAVAACLLMRAGARATPDEALAVVQRAAPAVRLTSAQERFVREYAEAYARRFGKTSLACIPRRPPPWRLNEALALGRAQNATRRLRFDAQDGRLPCFEELTEVQVDRSGRAMRDVWEEVSPDYAVTGWPREGWAPWPEESGG